uniref:Uncharacterized protein n=1 Tax=Anguilla anguilla TaxID=7936 RepID=A0A0E9PFE1_ANGAN
MRCTQHAPVNTSYSVPNALSLTHLNIYGLYRPYSGFGKAAYFW